MLSDFIISSQAAATPDTRPRSLAGLSVEDLHTLRGMQLSLSLLATLSLCVVPHTYARSDHVELHLRHRVVHPNLPVTSWSEFGTFSVPSLPSISPSGTPVTFVPFESLPDDLSEFARHVDPTLDESFYQITVQKPGMSEAMWPVSVMKAVSIIS